MEDEGIYRYDIPLYLLSDREKERLKAVEDMIDNNWSLRQASLNSTIPRTTLTSFIKEKLSYISDELYILALKAIESRRSK